MSSQNRFLLDLLTNSFKSSLVDDSDVELAYYDQGYSELVKLLNQMGKMFYFVVTDVQEKIDILKKLRENFSGSDNPYLSVNKMLAYEKANGLLDSKSPRFNDANGSRTLLRLHRALLFLYQLIVRLADASDTANMATITSDAYHATLAKYHPWAVRKAVGLATYALPHKETFLNNVVNQQTAEHCKTLENCRKLFSNESLPAMKEVFDRVESSYTRESLHKLP